MSHIMSRAGNAGHAGSCLSDLDFERLLEAWSADPQGQDIEVSIKLVCSGTVFRIGDRDAVIAMLCAEQARRRGLREAM